MTLLHLLPTFDYSAAGRQVGLLAPVLGKLTPAAVHVAALGPDGPVGDTLRAARVPVHALGTGRRLDPAAWWRLRRLVRDLRPDVVHAWRLPALRGTGALAALGRRAFRLVVSEPRRGGRLNRLDRRLLRTADAVIASHPAEAAALRRLGVPAEHVHELPPVVSPPPADPPPLGVPLPPDAVVLMCVGSLTPGHGFRDAIWAADIVLHVVPTLNVLIVGDGPGRAGLGRFARALHPGGRYIHFVPARADAAALLARAAVVWVPSRAECGRQVLLEAMAAGRPVVATALPGLAALVADERTGLLVPPGDLTALARQTRRLLDDPAFAARLAAAGRDAVAAFAPDRVAPDFAALYQA